jgi:stage II sporulation protein E
MVVSQQPVNHGTTYRGQVKEEPAMDREATRVTSRGSGHAVSLGHDKRVRISSTGVRGRRTEGSSNQNRFDRNGIDGDGFDRNKVDPEGANRVRDFWMHALSPGAVFCALIGILLGRAQVFGAGAPFGIAYLGVLAACRGPFAPLTTFGVLLGTNGLTLGPDSIWAVAPLVLVVIFARVFSRRVEARPFLLPVSIMVFGFLIPQVLEMILGVSQPSIAIVALEAVIGGLAAAIFSWGGVGRGFSALPQWGTLGPEQVASFGLLCAGVTMGLAGIELKGVPLGPVAAGIATTVIAHSGGAPFGAAAGALTGLACAVSGQGLAPIVGAYALGGLLAGSMRSYGKLASAIGFTAGAGLLVFQVSGRRNVLLFAAELGLSGLLFLLIPRKGLQRVAKLLPLLHRKTGGGGEAHARRVQELLSQKLVDFSKVFDELSSMLKQVPYDPELAERADVAHMLHEISSSVCSKCRAYLFCWGDAFHRTFRDVLNLVALAELKSRVEVAEVKDQLSWKCLNVPGLVAAVNGSTGSYRQNLAYARRLAEGRYMFSGQLQGIAEILDGLGEDVWACVELETSAEQRIMRELSRLGLGITEVSVVARRRGRLDVSVKKAACCGERECRNAVGPLISRILNRDLEVSKARCGNRAGQPTCEVMFSQARVYGIAGGVAVSAKHGADISGDAHSMLELADGRGVFIVSDGMGTGKGAAIESSTAVSMLERLLEAGFDDEFAVKTANLILLLRSPGETFATLDVATMDMVTGEVQFIKAGSPPSFIKRGRTVKAVESPSLPAGIFDAIEIQKTRQKLGDGDLVVMVSDGVLNSTAGLRGSAAPVHAPDDWVERLISTVTTERPDEIARLILNRALQYSGGLTSDDMTVLVVRTYKRRSRRRNPEESSSDDTSSRPRNLSLSI